MPNFETDDDGINRRMFPLRFNARFTRDDPDFNPKISKLLEQEDACERMIVKAVEGLRRCIENNGPPPNSESMAMLDDIKTMNNSIRQWMKDVDRDADRWLTIYSNLISLTPKELVEITNLLAKMGTRRLQRECK